MLAGRAPPPPGPLPSVPSYADGAHACEPPAEGGYDGWPLEWCGLYRSDGGGGDPAGGMSYDGGWWNVDGRWADASGADVWNDGGPAGRGWKPKSESSR